ncbi:hypothetical protein, partial [Thermus scotoductus]|uniref:hypothetical protein n=1 Tax=Thermus scotoductus TaxID=37636 RepID=UPI001C12BFE9
IDPTQFYVTDISKTKMDPMAKVIRKELKKRGIYKGVKVVISEEQPRKPRIDVTEQIVPDRVKEGIASRKAKNPPASLAFVPSVAGLILASVVFRDLLDL